MLHSDWLKQHKKEIRILLVITMILLVFMIWSDFSKGLHLIKEGQNVIAIARGNPEQTLSFPMNIETERDGEVQNYQVVISLQSLDDGTEGGSTANTDKTSDADGEPLLEDAITALVDEIETTQDMEIRLPGKLEDGTVLRWKRQKDFRFLLVFLLLPACLLYIYETERQREKNKRQQYEEEIRRALPSFVDQLLLLLNCGMIFHDAFYRITVGYEAREAQDAFSRLLARIRREADETGAMVITVMQNLSREVGMREYVRMVNILMDHQHRGVNLEEKLQAESRLLWEGRKAASIQKGKEMETKMTFPLALLLVVLMMIAGTPALMNM